MRIWYSPYYDKFWRCTSVNNSYGCAQTSVSHTADIETEADCRQLITAKLWIDVNYVTLTAKSKDTKQRMCIELEVNKCQIDKAYSVPRNSLNPLISLYALTDNIWQG